MSRLVAFLRAVNVGGRTVKMEQLKAIVAPLGFGDVATFIASGNLLFTAPARSAGRAERQVEEALRGALGYDVECFVRELGALRDVLAASPLDADAALAAGGGMQVGFLKAAPGPETAARVAALDTASDTLRVVGREVYWRHAAGFSDSEVKPTRLAKALGAPVTFRNVTTVRRLAAMAG